MPGSRQLIKPGEDSHMIPMMEIGPDVVGVIGAEIAGVIFADIKIWLHIGREQALLFMSVVMVMGVMPVVTLMMVAMMMCFCSRGPHKARHGGERC